MLLLIGGAGAGTGDTVTEVTRVTGGAAAEVLSSVVVIETVTTLAGGVSSRVDVTVTVAEEIESETETESETAGEIPSGVGVEVEVEAGRSGGRAVDGRVGGGGAVDSDKVNVGSVENQAGTEDKASEVETGGAGAVSRPKMARAAKRRTTIMVETFMLPAVSASTLGEGLEDLRRVDGVRVFA